MKKHQGPLSAEVLINAIPKNARVTVDADDVIYSDRLNSRLMQIYLAYLVQNMAKSWMSGVSIKSIVKPEGSGNLLSVHHIFPRKFLERNDIDVSEGNSMANYALLSQQDNDTLSDRDPQEAYRELERSQKNMAAKQFIKYGRDDILTLEGMEAFHEMRAAQMAEALNEFMGL